MEIPAIKEISARPIAPEPKENPSKKPSLAREVDPSSRGFGQKINEAQRATVERLAENLNQFMKEISYNLQFVPDREAGVVVIKVLDGEGKVIRQIPPEAILSLSARIGESIGILVNSKF